MSNLLLPTRRRWLKSTAMLVATTAGCSRRVELQTASGQPVRLRFVLQDADLFALRFQP